MDKSILRKIVSTIFILLLLFFLSKIAMTYNSHSAMELWGIWDRWFPWITNLFFILLGSLVSYIILKKLNLLPKTSKKN